MTCELIRNRFTDYLDHALPPDEQSEVDAHLGACPACAEDLAAFQAAVSVLRTMPPVDPPEGLLERITAALDLTASEAAPRARRWPWRWLVPARGWTWKLPWRESWSWQQASAIAVAACALMGFVAVMRHGLVQPTAPPQAIGPAKFTETIPGAPSAAPPMPPFPATNAPTPPGASGPTAPGGPPPMPAEPAVGGGGPSAPSGPPPFSPPPMPGGMRRSPWGGGFGSRPPGTPHILPPPPPVNTSATKPTPSVAPAATKKTTPAPKPKPADAKKGPAAKSSAPPTPPKPAPSAPSRATIATVPRGEGGPAGPRGDVGALELAGGMGGGMAPARTYASEPSVAAPGSPADKPLITVRAQSGNGLALNFVPPATREVGQSSVAAIVVQPEDNVTNAVLKVFPRDGLQVTNAGPGGVVYQGELRAQQRTTVAVRMTATKPGTQSMRIRLNSEVPTANTDVDVSVPGFQPQRGLMAAAATSEFLGGKDVNLVLNETDIHDALLAVGVQAGLRVDLGPGVGGQSVNAQLQGVPAEAALKILCDDAGLRLRRDNGGFAIAKP